MNAGLLQLLVMNPESVPPTPQQLSALSVLADQWVQRGGTEGVWLAERLQGPVSDARRIELGYEEWPAEPDPRQQALSLEVGLTPLVNELAARRDFAIAVQVLGWLGTREEAQSMHALLDEKVREMLVLVEQRTLKVVSHHDWKYQLENGWQLDVFVRAYDFWRIDGLISPEGFVIPLIDFDSGPLAELNEYEPPSDIESEVYGLGLNPVRRWP